MKLIEHRRIIEYDTLSYAKDLESDRLVETFNNNRK